MNVRKVIAALVVAVLVVVVAVAIIQISAPGRTVIRPIEIDSSDEEKIRPSRSLRKDHRAPEENSPDRRTPPTGQPANPTHRRSVTIATPESGADPAPPPPPAPAGGDEADDDDESEDGEDSDDEGSND